LNALPGDCPIRYPFSLKVKILAYFTETSFGFVNIGFARTGYLCWLQLQRLFLSI